MLKKLLEVVSDYEQTPEGARAELEEDGVDVAAFLARLQERANDEPVCTIGSERKGNP